MSGGLIGLGGKLRAGKDAVGDYLESTQGFIKLGMSDALNAALLKLNPYIPCDDIPSRLTGTHRYQELHDEVGYVEAKKNPEVRRLLQVLGTEVGRDMIDPDVWVKIAEKKILEHWEAGKDVVITAIRFPNELEMIRRLGGTSIWIERPVPVQPYVGNPAYEIAEHASENSVSETDFSWTIYNAGTLEDLYEATERVLKVYSYDALPPETAQNRF